MTVGEASIRARRARLAKEGMHEWHVVPVASVLGEHLPVHGQRIGVDSEDFVLGEAEWPTEDVDEIGADPLREWFRVVVEVHEHEPEDHLARQRNKREVLLAKASPVVGLLAGDSDEVSLEGVDPEVVRATEGAAMAALFVDHQASAVPARVAERVDPALVVAV